MPLWLILTLAFMPMVVISVWAAWACYAMCEPELRWVEVTADPGEIPRWRRIVDPSLW